MSYQQVSFLKRFITGHLNDVYHLLNASVKSSLEDFIYDCRETADKTAEARELIESTEDLMQQTETLTAAVQNFCDKVLNESQKASKDRNGKKSP